MPDLAAILLGVLASALAAGAIFLAGRWLPALRGGAIAVGLGYAVGHAALFGWPAFPPLETSDWLPWLGLFAAAFGLAEPWLARRRWLAWRARFVVPALVPWLLLKVGESPGVGRIIVLTTVLTTLAISVEALAARRRGASLPLVFWAGAAGASVVLLLSGSGKLAEMAGIVAASMGAAFVLGWCRLIQPLAAGAAAAVTALLGAIVVTGCIYDVPISAGCLVLAAPSAAWIGELQAFQRLRPWKAVLARLGITLLCVGAAIAIAWQASPAFE